MQIKAVKTFLWVLLVSIIFMAIYVYGFVVKANGDNVEHIHVSWLIWQNKIPYKDFFQHHHPLVWYFFSPFTALMINNINIFAIFNSISILTLGLIVLVLANILKECNVTKAERLIFASVVMSAYSILYSADYRPDIFMVLFLFLGIRYLFKHISTQKLNDLVISFLCFFIGFSCSQKIVFNLVIVLGFVIYYLYKNKITKENFFISTILPIMLLSTYFVYLQINDSLVIFLKSNYLFNTEIPTIFGNRRIVFPPFEYYDFYLFVPIGFISSVYFLIKGKNIEKFLSILYLEELVLRLFYFSVFLHYNFLLLLLSIVLSAMLFARIKNIEKVYVIVGIIYICFAIFYSYKNTYLIEKNRSKTYYEYTFQNTTPCDYVINGYYSVYNLKAKDPGYYSILLGQIDILAEKQKIRNRDNLNALVLKYKPKIIFGGIYWDTYWEQRNKSIIAHMIDRNILETYYDRTYLKDIYVLKKEYQKQNCMYSNNKWEYVD